MKYIPRHTQSIEIDELIASIPSGGKSAEDVLTEFGCPEIPFDENVTMYYPAIISAMEEYASQYAHQQPVQEYSREQLENAWRAGRDYEYTEQFGRLPNPNKNFAQFMATHPPVNDGWVRVDDALPTVDIHVLVIERDIFGDVEVSIARRSHDMGWYRPFKDITASVTHWRPLPEPPKQ